MSNSGTTNNLIKVAGYSQKVSYAGGIEYRNFSPDLVGVQLASDGGTPLFTMGNFNITTNMEPKTNKSFISNKFSNFVSLTDLDLSIEETQILLDDNANVILNLDKTNLNYYALFGSLTEFVRVSLEEIITKWPASLYMTPVSQTSDGFVINGYTFENYTYDSLTEIAKFRINTTFINNKFGINYLTNGTIVDTFNATNDLRNLMVNYLSYAVLYNGVEYPVLGFTGATTTTNDYIYFEIKGDSFSGLSGSSKVLYHIKPNKSFEEQFFNSLPDFEYYLLNRQITPVYTASFRYPIKSDEGVILYITESLTWPVSDGYNIDFDTTNYVNYATSLLDLATNSDLYSSNLMTRFLVTESISDFDTTPVHLGPLDQDTSGGKMNKTLHIYGREYDEINKYILGIAFANTVTYDKQDNTPDIYLKNLAKVLGWELVSSILEQDLLANYVTTAPSTYSGQTVGLTAVEADTELWRRIILNTPWIWKSKGARKSIEFLLRFIGAPQGLIKFNEYIYKAEGPIDIDLFIEALKLNGLETDLSLYPVDSDGYPTPLPDSLNMYYQNNGLWYRETGGSGSTIDILTGNNPHLGPYDGGFKYINQFSSLIPNFSAVTVSSDTITSGTTNLFTNYKLGTMDGGSNQTYVDSMYADGSSLPNCVVVTSEIETDPQPKTIYNDCGCNCGPDGDSLLSICVNENDNCSIDKSFKLILNPKGNDGTLFYVEDNDNCALDVQFDYLFKIKCETLGSILTSNSGVCPTPVDVFETFDTSITIDIVTSANTLETVFEGPLLSPIGTGNLYSYLTTNVNSGFYVCGDPIGNEPFSACTPLSLTLTANPQTNVYTCVNVIESIISSLYSEAIAINPTLTSQEFYDSFSQTALASQWLTYKTTISDPSILNLIANKKIKLTIKINKTCSDFCVLVDEISLNKVCTHTENKSIFLTQSPGFDLERIRDNKKSWVDNSTPTNRPFVITTNTGGNAIRQTNYDVNVERLIINSKEIDLDISLASAIETDVWCYLADNSCLLSAITSCNSCFQNTTFSCPVGYLITPANDACINIETTGVTTGSSIYIATHISNPAWGINGTYFYENIDNFIYPLNYSGASIITNSTIRDNNGTGTTVGIDTIVTSSGNTLWMNVYNGLNTNGRLNQNGVWDTSVPNNTWVGFSYCLDIPQSGVYSLGIAGDNDVRIKINGELIVSLTAGYEYYRYRRWHVFQITLTSGLNIIELEGLNRAGSAGFGAEIYDAPTSVLSAMTTTLQLSGVTLFSTFDRIGDELPLGSFSCPTGYSLNTCNVNNYSCTKITKIPPTINSGSSGSSVTTICCGDYINFNSFLSQPLSAITTIEDFEYFISSELIDVKSRKTLSGYPTLRALYDRYMNSDSLCQTNSSKFDYVNMNQFANLVGNYWVDIVEQVVPATTIWGSVKVYSNTLFDQQKFKYRTYSSLFGANSFSGQTVPSPIYGNCPPINVIMTSLNPPSTGLTTSNPVITTYDTICLVQMNIGSEFIGTVTIIGSNQNNNNNGGIYAI